MSKVNDYIKKYLGVESNESKKTTDQKSGSSTAQQTQKSSGRSKIDDYISRYSNDDYIKSIAKSTRRVSLPTNGYEAERQEMLNFDLGAGRREIEEYEKNSPALVNEYYNLYQQRTDYMRGTMGESDSYSDQLSARMQEILDKLGVETITGVKDKLSQKKAYLTQAERVQNNERLGSVGDAASKHYDPEYSIWAGRKDYGNPTREELAYYDRATNQSYWRAEMDGTVYDAYGDAVDVSRTDTKGNIIHPAQESGKYSVNDKLGLFLNASEEERLEAQASHLHTGGTWDSIVAEGVTNNWDLLTDSEIDTYYYHLGKNGQETAMEYLNGLQDALNYRRAEANFDPDASSMEKYLYAVAAGLDQAGTGLASVGAAIRGDDSYKATTATQYKSGMVRESLADEGAKLPEWLGGGSVGQGAYDLISTTANMAPSIVTSMVTNPALGVAVLSGSAAGSAYQEMINNGYSKEQARTYGVLVGASEAIMEKLIGGISKLGGGVLGKTAQKFLKNADNALLRAAADSKVVRIVGNMVEEGAEEGLQEILSGWFESAVTGAEYDVSSADVLYSTLLGALTGGVFEGADVGTEAVYKHLNGRNADTDSAKVQESPVVQNMPAVVDKSAEKGVAVDTATETPAANGQQVTGKLTAEESSAVGKDTNVPSKTGENAPVTLAEASKKYGDQAEVMVRAYQTGQDVTLYDNAYRFAYETGKEGASYEFLENSEAASYLTDSQKDLAYSAGVDAARLENRFEGFTAIDGEKISVQIGGKELNMAEVTLPDKGDNLVLHSVAGFSNISPEAANTVMQAYLEGKISAEAFSIGAEQAYRWGYYGYSQKKLAAQEEAAQLTEAQRSAVYQAGRDAAAHYYAQTQKAAAGNTSATAKKGGVYYGYDGKTMNTRQASGLTEQQRVGVEFARKLAKSRGMTIYFYESYVDESRNRVYKNQKGEIVPAHKGYYDPSDGSIHIDLNAGETGQGTVLFTIAHELTHFIKDWSGAHFKKLADIVVEKYGEWDISVDEAVKQQQIDAEAAGRELSYDDAFEEVVASSMENILTDGKVMEFMAELEQKDKTLADKVKEFFRDIMDLIRDTINAYKNISPESFEANVTAQMEDVLEQLEQIFAEGVYEGGESYRRAEKSTTGEGGVKYQATPSVKNPNRLDPRTVTREDVQRMLEGVEAGNYADNTYIPIRISTPGIVQERLFAENLPMAMPVKKIRQAFRPDGGKVQGKNILGHGLTVNDLLFIIENLDSPDYLFSQPDGRGVAVLKLGEEINKTAVIVEFGDNINAPYMNGYEEGKYNISITAFEIDDGDVGMFMYQMNKNWRKVFDKQKEGDPAKKFQATRPFAIEQDSLKEIVNEKNPEVKVKLSARKNLNAEALAHFGRTYSWKETGYLLTDGSKLDFSGRHEGASGGYRTVDHRDILDIYPEDTELDGNGAMVDFMQQGNIRISPEGDGINLQVRPTKAQERSLDDFISRARGWVTLDIDDAKGNTVVSVEYPRGTRASKVLQDIRNYFERGTEPQISQVAQFHYSARYQRRKDAAQILETENTKLQKEVGYLRQLLKLQRTVTGGTKFTKSSVEQMARMLKESAGAKGNTQELAEMLNGFYEFIATDKELTWESVREKAQPIVNWLQSHVQMKNRRSEYAQDILSHLHGSRIYLDESQKAEAAHRYGSFDAYRKRAMGSIVIAKDGSVSLDTKWQELAQMYPDVFDADTTSTDMPGALMDALDRLRNTDTTALEYFHNRDLIAQDLLRQVYDSYWRVSTLYTVADVKQKEINALKAKHTERMETLRQDYHDRVERMKMQHREAMRQRDSQWKKRLENQQKEISGRYEQTQKNKAEGRKKKEMRMKIRKVIRDLDKILNRGDKKRNVKEDMKDFVAKALSSAEVLFTDYHSNEDIIRNGFGVELTEAEAKYAEEAKAILKEMAALPSGSYEAWQDRQETEKTLQSRLDYRMAKLKDAFTRERQRLYKATVSSVLGDLADSYARLEDAEHAYVNGAYHESVHEYLKMLQEDMGGTTVKNMTLNQLEELHKAYTMVLTTVQNANKMFAEGLTQGRSEIANSIMTEVHASGGEHGLWSKSEISRNRASWNNTKPIYAAERLGSPTFAKVFSGLFQGQYQWATDMDEAKVFRQKIADKYGSKNWDMEKLYSFTSSSGIDFQLNLNQIMSLYAYSKREQAHEHLLKGGFVFGKNTEVVVTEHGIKRTYLNKSAKAHNVSDAILADIVSNLTKEQKGFVDEMQDYLSTTMGAKGNEVSMRLCGVKLFLEKYYFPLRSAGQFKEKAKEAELKQQQGHISIANSGFTHGTKPKASNAVVLDGFTDVWASHVNEMSMYHAMVLPMEDFRRVYNYASPNMEGAETVSVNSVIENAYGDAATGYFDQLYKELNGGAITDPRETAFKERIGKFKKAAVMLSSSVVVQQFSAVGRAFALIDPKHFIGPKVDQKRHKMLWAEMKQYAPVATIKEMGGFDTHTGGSAKDFLLAEEYEKGERLKALREDKQYRDEIMGLAPAMADELTWCTIWAAVKREIKAQNPKMDTQSEAFLRKAGERFSEVIEKTQVYDSVLARSANMRSKNGLLQMATAFMAEPTTTANMVEDAIRKGNKKQIARTLGAVATSIVLNNALASMVYAMRDDDEDETFMEKYSQAFASGMLDDMNPLTYYPFLKDVWSLLQGYDVERSDMSVVADVVDAAKKLATAISKYDEDMDEEAFAEYCKSIGDSLLSLLDAGCSALGIPEKNVRREILALMNTGKILTEDIFGERDTTWNSFWDAVGAAVLDAIPVVGLFAGENKGDKLYDAIVSGDAVYAERLRGGYKSNSAYNSAIRKALRENDPRIREAALAWNANNLDKYMQIAKAIIAEKHFSQDEVVAAIRAEASAMAPEESSSTAAKAKGIFTAEKFASAIAQGDAEMAKAVKEDIIQTAQINGKTAEEAEKSFADSAKSAMKEMFLEGTITEAQVILGLRDHCGLTQLQAKADVQYWAFKQQHPDTYAADSWFDAYYEDVEASGIKIKDYMDYRNAVKDITGEGKKERRMDVINSLPITKAQKDALYYAEGWAESTIDEAPWH